MAALLYKALLGSVLRKLCSTKKLWEVLCATFLVHSSTGKCFVQPLLYTEVLGSALYGLCSTE